MIQRVQVLAIRGLRMAFTALWGLVFGMLLVLSSPVWVSPLLDVWDGWFPVITPVSARVVEREPDAVLLHIVAHKNRDEECRLVRIYGYGIAIDNTHVVATVRRPDGSEHMGITHGKGLHDFGEWRVQPVAPGSVRVRVRVEHNCLGRIIPSTMAEAKL